MGDRIEAATRPSAADEDARVLEIVGRKEWTTGVELAAVLKADGWKTGWGTGAIARLLKRGRMESRHIPGTMTFFGRPRCEYRVVAHPEGADHAR